MKKLCLLLAASLAATPWLHATVRLPALFQDHLVLQRDAPVPVWGWAKPGERVTVKLGAEKPVRTKADARGQWRVDLKRNHASMRPVQLVVAGENTIVLNDVLVGEVWVCSGQSNMERQLGPRPPQQPILHWAEEAAAANYPQLRMFTVRKATADQPQTDCQGAWAVCSPSTVTDFSAVGYFFALKLYQELDVPVGMIHSSWGGTVAEAWTSLDALAVNPAFDAIVHRRSTARAGNPNRAAVLYNAMIAPLIPYRIRGVIWYQGESNVSRAWQYRLLFPTLINDWRAAWHEGTFPFYYVQIAPFRYGREDPRACPELWEAQMMTLQVPHTGMAVLTDISDVHDIHPPNKKEVGRRLALWALAKDYRHHLVFSGPLYQELKIEGAALRLSFQYTGAGLATRDGAPPDSFEVAGVDRKFVPAHARIEGDTVVVWSDTVSQPVAARYAWRDGAQPNLMNKEGLPASPFRTDRWPAVTADRQ